MWISVPKSGLVAMCVAAWLCGEPSVSAQGCGEAYGFYECIDVESTYKIRTPEIVDPNYRFPVVVVLHDAGGNGTDVVDDERLIAGFIENGFAVLVPDAQKKFNLRFRYRGEKQEAQSPIRGTLGIAEGEAAYNYVRNKKNFALTDADGRIRHLKYKKDSG